MTRRKSEQAVMPKSWNEVSLLLVPRVDQKTSLDNWISQILTKCCHDQEKAWTGSNALIMEWNLLLPVPRVDQKTSFDNWMSQILTKRSHDQEKAWSGSNAQIMELLLVPRVDQKTSFDNWVSQILTKRCHDQEKAWTGSNTQVMEWSFIITGSSGEPENQPRQLNIVDTNKALSWPGESLNRQ